MNILIACEFSGVVRDEFIRRGHNAISCDILPTESPGPHRIGDVVPMLNQGWDMMIAFPPCTYLTTTANKYFLCNPERWKSRLDAMLFVWNLWTAPIPKICIENPKGVITSHIRKADQYVHPYHFGDPYRKMTGLWLKNLPKLKYTHVVEPDDIFYNSKRTKSGKSRYSHFGKMGKGHGKERSVFPHGIAHAMANQWG